MENDGNCAVLPSDESQQNVKPKFCEVYEGQRKLDARNNNQNRPELQSALCSEEEFFKSMVSSGYGSLDMFSGHDLLDGLTTKFSGMNREDVCLRILDSIEKFDAENDSEASANPSLLSVKEFLMSHLVDIENSKTSRCQNEATSSTENNDSINSVSSLGILDLSDLSNTDSFEGISGQSFTMSFSDATAEFQKEIADLQLQNRKLVDENQMFRSQTSTSEELNQILINENNELKKDIKSLQQHLISMSELETKNDSMRTSLLSAENSEKVLLAKVNELEKKNIALEMDLKDVSEKLQQSHCDTEEQLEKLKKSAKTLKELKQSKQEVELEKAAIEFELRMRKVDYVELESIVRELTDTNESLRLDNCAIKSELEKTNLNFERLVEKQLQSLSSIISPSFSTPEIRADTVTSTPVQQKLPKRSLCSEVKEATSPSEALPIPFCGIPVVKKSTSRKSSGPVNRRLHFSKKNVPDATPIKNSSPVVKESPAELRRKQFSKQLKHIGDGPSRCSREHLRNLSSPNRSSGSQHSISKVSSRSPGSSKASIKGKENLTGRSPKVLQDNSSQNFLLLLFKEIQLQTAYITKVNVQVKEALQIDLDVLKLEKESLDVKEESLELKIDTKAAGDSGMPPHSVAECNDKMISDITSTDIRDQISAEIKALKTQLVRSHALLSYLQEKENYSSASFTPDRYNQKTSGQRGKNNLQQQKSFDAHTSCFHQFSHKDSVSTASHRSTPLHLLSHRAQSCPTFLDDLSVVSKSTQTEVPGVGGGPVTFVAPRYVPVLKVRESYLASTSEVSSKSNDNLECGVCEVHPIVEEDDDPTSTTLPRQRTNSFLTAIVQSSESASPGDSERSAPKESFHSQHASRRSSFQSRRVVKIVDDDDREEEKIKECPDDKCSSSSAPTAAGSEVEKTRSEKEKSFKTSQRSLRRGSGAGSPNSLSSIPRCPAFDLDEQDEEHTLSVSIPTEKTSEQTVEMIPKVQDTDESSQMQIKDSTTSNLKETVHVRQEPTNKAMLMPEVENSETESAKGSFEFESLEAPPVASDITSTVLDAAFPSLSSALLQQLGIVKDNPLMESFNEQELESKFNSLALIFKTDRMTLTKRLDIQKRQRDIAEKDVENEIKSIRASLHYLNLNAQSSETRDLIAKIQTHIDIVSLATSKVSARSETYGAVKQEERVSGSFEVMLHHAENLRRLFDKEHRELEETKRILSGVQTPSKKSTHGGPEILLDDQHKKTLKTFGLAIGTVKSVFSFRALGSYVRKILQIVRRASVADLHHHSLNGSFKFANLSQTWTTSGMKDTTNRLVGVFSPFSSLTSVGSSSDSNSTTTRPVATLQLPARPSFKGPGRRCSLPVTSSSSVGGAFLSTPLLLQPQDPLKKSLASKDSKISVAPKLPSVADEEKTDDDDVDESESPEVNRVVVSGANEDVSRTSYGYARRRLIVHRSRYHEERYSDIDDFTDISEELNLGAISYKTRAVQLLERLGVSRVQQMWNETSSANLLRYFLSLAFAFGAVVMFFQSIG